MTNPDQERSTTPQPGNPFEVPISSSPGSLRGRTFSTSLPRADVTARLASPVPSHAFGTSPTLRASVPNRDSDENIDNSGPLAGAGQSTAGPGVSALAAALSNSIGTSPPRFGTPPIRSSSPAGTASGLQPSITPTNYGSFEARSRHLQAGGSGAYEDPEIVKRHLVQPTDAGETGSNNGDHSKGKQVGESVDPGQDGDEFSSLKLQGGDITRQIYRWTEDAEGRSRHQRSKSFSHARDDPESDVLDINTIKIPGGFRRNYIRRAARSPPLDPQELEAGEGTSRGRRDPQLFTNSFLEFLSIYGHFAGEELEEDDEVLGPGEYFSSGESDDFYDSEEEREPMEDSTLLTPSKRKRRRKVRGGSGNNSPFNAALLLLKSFVGTGVLFLPRAYFNGGMLFSNLVLLFVAALSYYCFVLLVTTRLKVDGSFGDIGGILYGDWMRTLILFSIVISQIGFVAAYIVFTAENLQAFILAVSNCNAHIQITWLIVMQMIIFLPFSLFRDIGKLGFTALIADAFIVIGLAYLFYYDILTLNTNGLADIIQFNQKDWTLFIGTAIFTFEGIGLIIPIQESMKSPSKFPKVMFYVMIIISVLFITMGAVSYAAYGSKTETVVLLNLPQDNKLVNGVQFLYSLAILLSTPLQIFPAIRITENALFTRSGKYNPYIKWQKNLFRFLIVFLCALIAWGGADDLDKFVALVGNFACIPLVYIYPPLLHYKGVARSRVRKVTDILLCIFGFVAMAYTTSLTVISWASGPSGPSLPKHCDPNKF
ncbi:transmembrane amino acid transporter protein-domain-containing protein [Hypoxylon trugodes]|uniref:transmembrane amino acid transporter protein-domain-containing protein n=1 Tax=Hypoxylon trugodes TaxID=326681 RepID=UPI0021917ACC|nr:transmembrane amino acid transporter protein-domain-containing protein [Hypoxylon trugodes]KAI1390959.1 transmembrane amino acid transporter protein-domain-containing protein [Hypoxylon trugodes]